LRILFCFKPLGLSSRIVPLLSEFCTGCLEG
jgi:hypothetical protein